MRVLVVDSSNRAAHLATLEAMHRHRHRIFVETLGWTGLSGANGRDIDAFDTADATYLIALDRDGGLRGSARFLSTTGAHLFEGPLRQFVEGEAPRGPGIVEWSRHAPGDPAWPPNVNAAARLALNLGALEWALLKGVTDFVAVLETWLLPRARSFGWACTPLGAPRAYGEGEAIAVRIPVDATLLQTLRDKHGQRETLLVYAHGRAA